jgi:hypothetical protein
MSWSEFALHLLKNPGLLMMLIFWIGILVALSLPILHSLRALLS